mmetsp:Transcript_3731/g.4343  ORF Transcript_3731/g.4343 Transcript_3731/m.4343 type:complete len:122 (+) Transcript_3731:1116-1481(+)
MEGLLSKQKEDFSLFNEIERMNNIKNLPGQDKINKASLSKLPDLTSPQYVPSYRPPVNNHPPQDPVNEYYARKNSENKGLNKYESSALAAQYIIASDPMFQSAQTYMSYPYSDLSSRQGYR